MQSKGQLKMNGHEYVLISLDEYLEWLEDQEDIEAARKARINAKYVPLSEVLAKQGNRIAQFRKSRKISQKDLANVLGVTQSHLSRWETGSVYPNTANINALADALDCEVTDLFPGA